MLDKELTTLILSANEKPLAYLDNDAVQLKETNEMFKLRTLEIKHPIYDEYSFLNELLRHGNKIWKPYTCDGDSCLYVLNTDKNVESDMITITAEEVAGELSQMPPVRSASFDWTVNSSFIQLYFGKYFTSGVLDAPATHVYYNGCLSPMAILREIETQLGVEFRFRYVSTDGIKIERYIDCNTGAVTTHTIPIELGINASEISVKTNEADTRIAAAPTGKPSNDKKETSDTFHQTMLAWENLEVNPGTTIPSYITKDDAGVRQEGFYIDPPYHKVAGSNIVECTNPSELVANYQRMEYMADHSSGSDPRTSYFDIGSETEPYNIYWNAVKEIRSKSQPTVDIPSKVIDRKKLDGLVSEYYNYGDAVYVWVPGYTAPVQARVTKTVKNPRTPESDEITVGNYQVNFFDTFNRSAGAVDLY